MCGMAGQAGKAIRESKSLGLSSLLFCFLLLLLLFSYSSVVGLGVLGCYSSVLACFRVLVLFFYSLRADVSPLLCLKRIVSLRPTLHCLVSSFCRRSPLFFLNPTTPPPVETTPPYMCSPATPYNPTSSLPISTKKQTHQTHHQLLHAPSPARRTVPKRRQASLLREVGDHGLQGLVNKGVTVPRIRRRRVVVPPALALPLWREVGREREKDKERKGEGKRMSLWTEKATPAPARILPRPKVQKVPRRERVPLSLPLSLSLHPPTGPTHHPDPLARVLCHVVERVHRRAHRLLDAHVGGGGLGGARVRKRMKSLSVFMRFIHYRHIYASTVGTSC